MLACLWSLLFHLLCIGLFYLIYEAEGRKVTHPRSPFAQGVQNAEKSLRGIGPNSRTVAAPSQRRFALTHIIVCCGASIVAHFARKVRAMIFAANIANALGHDFVGFLAVFGRHNIRAPHFASKVSYNASPQTFAEYSRSANL